MTEIDGNSDSPVYVVVSQSGVLAIGKSCSQMLQMMDGHDMHQVFSIGTRKNFLLKMARWKKS